MTTKRRRFTADFKKKVALEALRGDCTVQAIAARHGVHPNQVSAWERRRSSIRTKAASSPAGTGRIRSKRPAFRSPWIKCVPIRTVKPSILWYKSRYDHYKLLFLLSCWRRAGRFEFCAKFTHLGIRTAL